MFAAAHIDADGTVITGERLTSAQRLGVGRYRITTTEARPANGSVVLTAATLERAVAVTWLAPQGADTIIDVFTRDALARELVDAPFSVVVLGVPQ